MATGAIRRELCGFMVGIGGLVIIVDMTACTGVWGVVVVAFMAGGARIGNAGMRAFQGVIIIVNGKGGRLPGVGGMAGGAVGWDSQCYVVWVGTLVIIRRMAADTIRRCAGVARWMTGQAGRRLVRARQWEVGFVVVESGRYPGGFAMTTGAVF